VSESTTSTTVAEKENFFHVLIIETVLKRFVHRAQNKNLQ